MSDPDGSAERLRAHQTASSVPDGGGYHPFHYTPLRGEPLHDGALELLRQRGAEAFFDDLGWRHDHGALAAVAARAIASGDRPRAAWRYLASHPELGLGPIREGLEALAFVLGLDLRLVDDGVQVALMHRRPPDAWSSGMIETSAAFRGGEPASGGMHDPALVGARGAARFAHIELPWRLLPRHLLGRVAELVDRAESDLLKETRSNGVEWLVPELDRALERRLPRPLSLDGSPLRAIDFLWSEVPVVPGTFRRPVRRDGKRSPHGLDGPLHRLIAAVRRRRKLGVLEPDLEAELRRHVQDALDAYLSYTPHGEEAHGEEEEWGWSVAEDLQGTLRVDGMMVDWGGRAVCVVEDRPDLGLPEGLREAMPDPDDPGPVLLVRMPSGAAVAQPSWVPGSCIRLPIGLADAMGAKPGELLRVIPALSQDAKLELTAIAEGIRMSPLPGEPGFLDAVAAAPPHAAARVLANATTETAIDRTHGPVGRRVYAGALPPVRGAASEEVDRVHRGFHLLLRLAEGPGGTLPPGVAAEKLEMVEEQLGAPVVPEIRALWTVHDGQTGDGAPLVYFDGLPWRLLSLEPERLRGDRLPLAVGAGREVLEIDSKGRIWRGDCLVGRSLGRLLQVSFLRQR